MSSSSLRGWVLGLALAVGSGAGSYLAVSHEQQAQAERLDLMAGELSSLRKAVMSRPPAPPSGGSGGVAAGIPPAMQTGEARLRPEDLDAIATRMVTQLQQSGVFDSATGEPRPPPGPVPLKPEQQESLARANGLVDRVLSSGKMTMEDVHQIRRELAMLKSRSEADDVRRRIMVAINKNQLVQEPTGSPRGPRGDAVAPRRRRRVDAGRRKPRSW
jgi:hypothetical protein